MTAATSAEFVELLRSYRLLEPALLEEVEQTLAVEFPEPHALAQQLIERDWLTPYQVSQLFLGRGQDLVLGSYVLLDRLGEGGMGAVFKARHRRLERLDALKVIRTEHVANAQAVQRFHQEARAAARLTHPNIVAVYDANESNGIHFLAIEYLEGTDLGRLVKEKGPLPIELACDYIRQAALGLQHAHEKGLVHRDIKPANLFLNRKSGMLKVLDLGLARLQQRSTNDTGAAGLTHSGAVMGTPNYMAPEQALHPHQVDIRADVYSLGCTLHYLLTGQPPFPGGEMTEKLIKHQLHEPVPVEQLRPDVPPEVAAIVRKLMAKRPEDRYQTPAEVAAILDYLTRREGVCPSAVTVDIRKRGARAEELNTPTFLDRSQRQRARRRFRLGIGGGVVLLLAVAVFAYLFWRGVPLPSPPSTLNETPAATLTVRVEANQLWQDAGIDVPAGQTVILVPEGLWRNGQQLIPARGMEQASHHRVVLPQAPWMCLLARVGDEAPAAVLTTTQLKAQRGGRLFMQANDLDLTANSGAVKVGVGGGLRAEDQAPAPPLLPIQVTEQALRLLLAREKDPAVRPEESREEILDFCQKHRGLPQALLAAQKLPGLPPLVNSIGMKLAPIPPGSFRMGSSPTEPGRREDEGPQREVEITRPFYMGVHEVTVGQFKAFIKETGYQTEAEKGGGAFVRQPDGKWASDPTANWQTPGFDQTDEYPVVCVSWNDAQAFCSWLSAKERKKYALPTEAQWEYSARAGSPSKFGFGDDDEELTEYAWYYANSRWKAHPAGQKKSNAWGLYDMHGNAWEWCQDWYDKDYYQESPKLDPLGPSDGTRRVLRGGAWSYDLTYSRAAYRGSSLPSFRDDHGGFRVVLAR
jgi:formylglycine-generating enzyme required for sulfatase activity/tRNA A-37 threonylcarbamoyl transferase component Bud32